MIHLKAMIHIAKTTNSEDNLEDFFELIERVKPFVFTSDPQKPNTTKFKTTLEMDQLELDLPFEVCSFEDINWRKTIVIGDDVKTSGNAKDGFNIKGTELPPLRVSCFLVYESAPKEYCFWVYDSYDDFVAHVTKDSPYYQSVAQIVKNDFLNRLNDSEIGITKVKERIKINNKGKKKQIKINKLVYVSTKENKQHANRVGIDWSYSHRWEVRGHWRAIKEEALGKNRDGDYCMRNYTWVKDHTKGPEDAPLVADKVRLVSNKKEE